MLEETNKSKEIQKNILPQETPEIKKPSLKSNKKSTVINNKTVKLNDQKNNNKDINPINNINNNIN